MEQETKEQSASQEETRRDVAVVTPAQGDVVGAPPTSECPVRPARARRFHAGLPRYAIGRIEARFPRLSVEKEFAQATGRAETAGQTDQQAFHDVLSKPENRYLARQLCWVLTIQGLETYLVQPSRSQRISIGWWRPSARSRAPWTSMSSSVCGGLSLRRSFATG